MSRLFRRRRWVDAAWIAKLENEVIAQRDIIADLGRRLHAAQHGPLGDNPLTDTVPLPRMRSAAAVLPFPPKEWTS